MSEGSVESLWDDSPSIRLGVLNQTGHPIHVHFHVLQALGGEGNGMPLGVELVLQIDAGIQVIVARFMGQNDDPQRGWSTVDGKQDPAAAARALRSQKILPLKQLESPQHGHGAYAQIPGKNVTAGHLVLPAASLNPVPEV